MLVASVQVRVFVSDLFHVATAFSETIRNFAQAVHSSSLARYSAKFAFSYEATDVPIASLRVRH
jgi:hypothetical protein